MGQILENKGKYWTIMENKGTYGKMMRNHGKKIFHG
jgi:hypothetical protein